MQERLQDAKMQTFREAQDQSVRNEISRMRLGLEITLTEPELASALSLVGQGKTLLGHIEAALQKRGRLYTYYELATIVAALKTLFALDENSMQWRHPDFGNN